MTAKHIIPEVGGFITGFLRKRQDNEPISPPVLTNPSRVPYGSFLFQVHVTSQSGYEIECSNNLKHWTTLSSEAKSGSVVEYIDTDAPKFSYRFYRARSGSLMSTNIIGYATVQLPPGYSLISNPFKSNNNSVGALLPNMPEYAAFCKFELKLFKLTNNVVKNGVWSNPQETLSPGEGALVCNPTDATKTINFVGEVVQGNLLNPVPAGFSIRSSMLPQSGRLDADLGLPLDEGDVIHMFDRDKQSYTEHRFGSKAWRVEPPVIGVGEAFWVGKSSAANWVQSFATN